MQVLKNIGDGLALTGARGQVGANGFGFTNAMDIITLSEDQEFIK